MTLVREAAMTAAGSIRNARPAINLIDLAN